MALILLGLIDRNLPLHLCARVRRGELEIQIPSGKGWANYKKIDAVARGMVNGCSHPAVVEELAREWLELPELLKRLFRDIARAGGLSGNATKGLLRLHKTTGDIFSVALVKEERVLVEHYGATGTEIRKKKREAVLGAERAYAAYKRPSNYDQLSRHERKRIARELTEARREGKQREW